MKDSTKEVLWHPAWIFLIFGIAWILLATQPMAKSLDQLPAKEKARIVAMYEIKKALATLDKYGVLDTLKAGCKVDARKAFTDKLKEKQKVKAIGRTPR